MGELVYERRRSPRFNCGGRARIVRLPSEGLIVSANLRNLSLGGICVDIPYPVDLGERAEVLVCVNAASFRTIGTVKATVERSRACMEFVSMSAGSKGLLADLVAQLTRLQKVMGNLRAERTESQGELFRQLEEAGVWATVFGDRPLKRGIIPEESVEPPRVIPDDQKERVEDLPVVIRVNLFG